MKKCLPNQISEVPADGVGQGLCVEIGQYKGDGGGWSIEVYAEFRGRSTLLVILPVSALLGKKPSRILFVGGAPGAERYNATVRPPPGPPAGKPLLKVFLHCSESLVSNVVLSS